MENLGQSVIKVDKLGIKYHLSEQRVESLSEYAVKRMRQQLHYHEFWALKNVTFSVERGERLALLGCNGAGKSTLLKAIAGIIKPSEGTVLTRGNVVPLLELGAGLDKQYTGAENIFLYGAMLGYPRKFIQERYEEIVEFSELGDFIHVPIKKYSSGMRARLGFSIATVMDADILILDEVLSVGDARFKKKSEKKIMSMFDSGVTVLFVSHNLKQAKKLCSSAVLLERGRLVGHGEMEEMAALYQERMKDDF